MTTDCNLPSLPHSPEAEAALLGGIILGNDGPWLDPCDFFLPFNQALCKALTRLKHEGKPIDLVLIADSLTEQELEACGGIAYIAGISDGLPRCKNFERYARIVHEKARLRELATLGDLACGANGDASQLLERVKDLSARIGMGTEKQSSELFDSYDELLNAPPLTFAIRDFLQNDGITLVGGLPGHGKTLVMLSMAKALLTGKPLWNHFPVEEKAVRVVYLVPECARGPFAHRLKLFGLLPFAAPDDRRLLVRTLSKGPAPHLDDPVVLSATKGAYVFLDTAIRFTDTRDENSAAENQLLAKDLFALLAAGARAVTGAHHSPKAFGRDNNMSLENVLRGSGDIGAILATCFGLKQIDKDQNIIHVENVKPRDFTPPLPFQLIGRPNLDETGDLMMLKKPGECGSLAEEQPELSNTNDSKHRERADRIANLRAWLSDDSNLGSTEIVAKFAAMGVEINEGTARKYKMEARRNAR